MSDLIQVKVNFRPEDHARLSELAKNNDMTIANYLRNLANAQDIKNQPSRRKSIRKTRAIEPIVLWHLRKIGINVNQIAKYTNTQKSLDRIILSALVDVQDYVKALIR